AGVVEDRALEGHDPGTAGGEGDIGVDRVLRVEVDEAGLHGLHLRVLVQVEQFGVLAGDALVLGGGGFDRLGQFRVRGRELAEGGVVEAFGAAPARVGAVPGAPGGGGPAAH